MRVLCGCCETGPTTPLEVYNRPALSAIAYRIGTYASFRSSMLQAIATHAELAMLSTRLGDDYAITMLEAWATVADVLTFYQERYVNEAYLRTARFRDSVTRLASLLDYRLRPGVAAQTSIAFELELEDEIKLTIPIGQMVQSVPADGAMPQIFETIEVLSADTRLNRQRVFPAPSVLNPLGVLQPGATLDRVTGPTRAASLAAGHTIVLFNDGTSDAHEEKTIQSIATVDDRIELHWNRPIQQPFWHDGTQAFRFQRTFRVFGHDAPATFMSPSKVSGRIVWDLVDTPGLTLAAGSSLDLDANYDKLAVGQKLLIVHASGLRRLTTVQSVEQVNATVGPLSASVTRIQISPGHSGGDRRRMRLYELVGEPLIFWPGRYPSLITGNRLYLPGVAIVDAERGTGVEVGRTISRNAFNRGQVIFPTELERGRKLLVEDGLPEHAPRLTTLKELPTIEPSTVGEGDFCHLVLELDIEAELSHDASSTVLLGNVAAASHGETVRDEVVGSGDRARPFLGLALRKKPLTFLPSATPSGTASTLELRVDRVRWNEVPGLYGQPADAPVFELRHNDDGSTIVQFGDGISGARPPTGQSNIRATYRVGSGLAGRVPAGSLTTLLRKPAGLARANNPLAAEGGADPESLEAARANAPRTVRTFGRAVSLEDVEDLVTASGEVRKSHATWAWDGLDRAIHLTVAGEAGGIFSADARRVLASNLNPARDPNHRLLIDNYSTVFVRLQAGVGIDPAYDRDEVLLAVHSAVVGALAFESLELGQSLHLSDFYRVMQDVAGVRFVDIDLFHFKPPPNVFPLFYYLARGATFAPVQRHLRVFSARPDPQNRGRILAAELAALESPTQDVVITAREI